MYNKKILTKINGNYTIKSDASPEVVQYMLEDINNRLEDSDQLSETFIIELYLLRVQAEQFLQECEEYLDERI